MLQPAEETALVPFEFEGAQVRVIDKNGVPWFVADDVCRVLDIKRSREAVEKLAEDEKGADSIRTPGGPQESWIVSESGLYALILRCRNAMKEGTAPYRFRRWVTGTVLPTIRKTGSYQAPAVEVPDLQDPDALCKLLLHHATKRIEAEKRAAIAEATVEVTQPKADVYDRIANADGCFGLQQAAKILGQAPGKFIRDLKATCLFYRGAQLVPRQDYIDRGLLELKVHMIDDKARCQSLITPKGLQFFAKKLGVELQRELFPKAVTA